MYAILCGIFFYWNNFYLIETKLLLQIRKVTDFWLLKRNILETLLRSSWMQA